MKLPERAAQTNTCKLKKAVDGNLNCQLTRILLNCRTTSHETIGCTSAELVMGRKLKTALPLLHAELTPTVSERQLGQETAHDKEDRLVPSL